MARMTKNANGSSITRSKQSIMDYAEKADTLIFEAARGVYVIGKESLLQMAQTMENDYVLKSGPVTEISTELFGLPVTGGLKNRTFYITSELDGKEYIPEGMQFFVTVTPESGESVSELNVLCFRQDSEGNIEAVGLLYPQYTEYPVRTPNGKIEIPQIYFTPTCNGYYMVVTKEQAAALKEAGDIEELNTIFRNLSGHWAENALQNLIDSGAFANWMRDNMEPDDPLTMGTLSMLLQWYAGDPTTLNNEADISDVDGFALREALKWAQECGLILGDGTRAPSIHDPITKEQLIVILDRLYTKKGIELPNLTPINILDMSSVSIWAWDSVSRFASAGVLTGVTDGYFNPNQYVTFGQFADVYQTIKDLVYQQDTLQDLPPIEPLADEPEGEDFDDEFEESEEDVTNPEDPDIPALTEESEEDVTPPEEPDISESENISNPGDIE